MFKIAVVGDRESIIGFKALGLDTFEAEDNEKAASLLHDLAKGNYAIIYITEQLAQAISEDIMRYQNDVTPAIILIPGKEGTLGIGQRALQTAVEKAVGADIL
ncbi:MAG: V-type ATP synthase subunit F [Clostridiales bacterium]